MNKEEKQKKNDNIRQIQKSFRKEEQLDSKNVWQISDPTPKAAVKRIVNGGAE